MAGRERAIIRQVQLMCADHPWIYARTVIPATSLRGKLQRLAHLGNRPLGAMLFADPGMQRGVVELARILPGQELFADATQAVASLHLGAPLGISYHGQAVAGQRDFPARLPVCQCAAAGLGNVTLPVDSADHFGVQLRHDDS